LPDPALIQALKDLGFGGMAVFALVASFRGWFVWRREHDAVKADRDFWREVALELKDVNKSALGVAEKATRRG
jgi:hypothetical protein